MGAKAEHGNHQRQRIIDFIQTHTATKGYAPSIREIGAALDMSSPAHVRHHLDTLKREGRIAWEPELNRTLRVVQEKEER